ncbi:MULTISPECIES: sensor histidine kinase [unclassified Arsukibacterium]|uniref:sensor histidine kinase n=1 Tax=unclassified Arsukibacterium TaxID=2635278 RepID=UPI000C3FA520|nr:MULTISPECIES: HAMP domain-containing sensor histidine kinase [unclassified Arsukibacterium]MBM33357.1 two-component sensor histidine kinase [Rheinheimera sp.]HAW91336.1 two-component sensor histidine kinase [Candidatus Azambacteria bacterium]|tara:strand:- start:3140 stop:3985 length:846 start_codon:yes stop_codon:yes gene_type:complete
MQLQQAVTELNDTNTELVKMQQQLIESAKLSQIGILVAGVAREITAPVTKSLEAADALQQEHLLIGQAMQNNVLKRSVFENYLQGSTVNISRLSQHLRRADELIQSFKAVAVDQSSEQRRNFILYDYLQQVLLSLRYELSDYDVKPDIKGDKILVLQSYPGSFSRILTNLVLNSLQHGFKTKQAQSIVIEYSILSDGQLQIQYRDNGVGMSEAVLARIFEPFYTTAQQNGGSGLGLSIVYNLVTQQLKGSIICESQPDHGTTFTITLPVRIVVKYRKNVGS